MYSTRAAVRCARAARTAAPLTKRNVPRPRFASSEANPQTAGGVSGAATGGLVGAAAALAVTYSWYHFSGAKTAVQTAKSAKGYYDKATESLKVKFEENTPDDANQALETIKQSAQKYAAFIPGGRQYVDSAFKDLDTVRQKHGDEVDAIVKEAYGELRDASKKGLSLETASDSYNVLSKHLQKLFSLAEDAAEEILNNHPQLKEKLGGSAEQLKQLGHRIGPEAKKEIDETWKEVQTIVQGGLQPENLNRARTLVQDKVEKLRKMSEEAFNQGWEQVKPMLEKNPEVKQFVEQNMDALKQGNTKEVIDKVRNAVSSGNTQELKDYAQK